MQANTKVTNSLHFSIYSVKGGQHSAKDKKEKKKKWQRESSAEKTEKKKSYHLIAPPSNPIPRRLVWWQWVSDLKSQMREIGFRFVDRKRESSAGVLEVRDWEKKIKKKNPSKNKLAEMLIPAKMTRNTSKFDLRWNGGLSRTGLQTSMRFSVRSGRNRTESTTLLHSHPTRLKSCQCPAG